MFTPFHSLYINTFTSKLQPNNIIYFNIVKQVVLITFLELIKVKINNGICSLFLNKCIIKVLLTLSIIKKIEKKFQVRYCFMNCLSSFCCTIPQYKKIFLKDSLKNMERGNTTKT